MTARVIPDDIWRRVFSVEEAAGIAGIARGSAYNAIKRDEFPHVWIGRRVVVPGPALARWLGLDPPNGSEPSPG